MKKIIEYMNVDYLLNNYFKYILHSCLLYFIINIITKKKCFSEKRTITIISFISSFIFFVINTIDTNEKTKNKDFLSNFNREHILNYPNYK